MFLRNKVYVALISCTCSVLAMEDSDSDWPSDSEWREKSLSLDPKFAFVDSRRRGRDKFENWINRTKKELGKDNTTKKELEQEKGEHKWYNEKWYEVIGEYNSDPNGKIQWVKSWCKGNKITFKSEAYNAWNFGWRHTLSSVGALLSYFFLRDNIYEKYIGDDPNGIDGTSMLQSAESFAFLAFIFMIIPTCVWVMRKGTRLTWHYQTAAALALTGVAFSGSALIQYNTHWEKMAQTADQAATDQVADTANKGIYNLEETTLTDQVTDNIEFTTNAGLYALVFSFLAVFLVLFIWSWCVKWTPQIRK